MTDLEAIDLRHSRRRYKGAVAAEELDAINRLIAGINRESALAISVVNDGATLFGGFLRNYGLFSGVQSFFAMVGYRQDHDLREKVGYFGERLVLELTKMGIGTCWVGGTFDRAALARTLDFGQELACVIVFGPVEDKTFFTESLVRQTMHRKTKGLEDMYTADAKPPPWFLAGVACAAKAPSHMNTQPVHFYWENGVARVRVPEKTAIERVDLGIAKLHFELGAGGHFEPGNGAAFGFLVSGGE